jgi:hypothetical protein
MKTLLLTFVCVIAFTACEARRTACVYEVPEGFTGWVFIEFENDGCPPLQNKDGKLVFHLGKDGRLCTSSKMEVGWAKDEYYYVGNSRTVISGTAPGGGGLVWGGGNGTVQNAGKKKKVFEIFFIGNEDQFNRAPKEPELNE